jgi:hypothetical protein
MRLFLKQRGEESGPYSLDQLAGLVRDGKLLPSDLLRQERRRWFGVRQEKGWIPVELLPGVPRNLSPAIRHSAKLGLVWVGAMLLLLAWAFLAYIVHK